MFACGVPYHGRVTSDNFVDIVGSVVDEHECKDRCVSNSECSVYTYYDSADESLSKVCVLLTSSALEEEVLPCTNCRSGPTECRTNSTCQVSVLTDSSGSKVHLPIFAEETFNLTLVAGENACFLELNVVAIGGGGGNGDLDTYPGAGSGCVDFKMVQLSRRRPTAEIIVGSFGEKSGVAIDGEMVVEAESGGDGDNVDGGGQGYSGGGGWGGGDGGTNGGDGEDGGVGSGGQGSGFDLATIAMDNFNLSPGKGGRGNSESGGGGGGVLVNGETPGVNEFNGQGYGGGGRLGSMGHQGCVLVEKKKIP